MITVVYRLEKDGYGPATHPRHGWIKGGIPQKNGTKLCRILHSTLKSPQGRRAWDKKEPDFVVGAMLVSLMRRYGFAYRHAGALLAEENIRFACPSRKTLISYWGRKFYRECLAMGFQVVAYEVPEEDLFGDGIGLQCAFLQEKGKHAPTRKAA